MPACTDICRLRLGIQVMSMLPGSLMEQSSAYGAIQSVGMQLECSKKIEMKPEDNGSKFEENG
eukprot:scaffold30140_cov55-Attheya_sp.AAC.6